MDDGCEGVDGRDVFVQESFNLADFRTAAAGAGDIEDGDPGDRNARDQRGAHDTLGGQRSCWRWGKEVAQGWVRVWEGAEFWIGINLCIFAR